MQIKHVKIVCPKIPSARAELVFFQEAYQPLV
jgi:hypothetical protein